MSMKFNAWSRRRIGDKRKFCTSRNHQVLDASVLGIVMLPWWFIRDRLYAIEGADSPDELQGVMNQVQRRIVGNKEMFWVHFGDFVLPDGGKR